MEYKNQLVTKQEKGYVIEGTDEVLSCYCFLFGKDKEVIAHGKESDLKNHRKTVLLKGGPFLGMLKLFTAPSSTINAIIEAKDLKPFCSDSGHLLSKYH